ncbi:hypothetical protein NDU88_005323 [Pleurodeles waltl]|uniref:Uncharacterized protein n=1 Tax=Pleurodeles waltl TaxID=8319 RepID=A0AAV7M900_PLEWA|nr:hypothetical protein NDU88_005323 [Pleurodeles waltl]
MRRPPNRGDEDYQSAWQWGVIRSSGTAGAVVDYRRGEGPPRLIPRAGRLTTSTSVRRPSEATQARTGWRPTRWKRVGASCARAEPQPCHEWKPDVESSVDRSEEAAQLKGLALLNLGPPGRGCAQAWVRAQGAGPGSAVARLPGERRRGQGLAEEGSSGLDKGPSTTQRVNLRCLDGYADPGRPDTQAIWGGSADKILLGAVARYFGR